MNPYPLGAGLLAATEEEQADFFSRLQECYQSGAARAGEIVRDFRVADTRVRLRFAGEGLLSSIVPGMALPLPDTEAVPQFEIWLWDSESTGVPIPAPHWWQYFTRRGNLWGDSARYRCAYHRGQGSVNGMDREMRQAVFWVPAHRHVPAWILASPLRTILHWWMELTGRQLVHAAAVGWDGRAVLIPGRGGSGKSSAALACLLAGMDFIADDFLALELDPEPRVYRLYSTAKLDPSSLVLYPELRTRCRTYHQVGFDKQVIFLDDGYRSQLPESLPLHLMLRPWISGRPETILGQTDARDIERALASETLAYLPYTGARTVEFLDRASREVPRAAIHMGTDRPRIAAAIRQVLARPEPPVSASIPAADPRPFVSVIVHSYEQDCDALRLLADQLDGEEYPRAELIVMASGPACRLRDGISRLPGNPRFFPLWRPVVNAEAWNCGIKESFAELLVWIEPGLRFSPGALDALVLASQQDAGAAWVLGGPQAPAGNRKLWGGLVRKSAFRECGLFSTDRFLQGREHDNWLRRAEAKGLRGHSLQTVQLDPGGVTRKPERLVLRPNLKRLRAAMMQQKTPL